MPLASNPPAISLPQGPTLRFATPRAPVTAPMKQVNSGRGYGSQRFKRSIRPPQQPEGETHGIDSPGLWPSLPPLSQPAETLNAFGVRTIALRFDGGA
jgi:hypothetical protein